MKKRLAAMPRTRIIGGPLDGISTRHTEKTFRTLKPSPITRIGKRDARDFITYRRVILKSYKTSEATTVYVSDDLDNEAAMRIAVDRLLFVHKLERTD